MCVKPRAPAKTLSAQNGGVQPVFMCDAGSLRGLASP